MKVLKLFFSLFIIFLFANAIKAQSLEDVLKKYYKAVNQEKLSTVQSIIVKGRVNQNGFEIPFIMYQKRPQKLRTEGTFQGMTVLQVYDGEKGWSVNPFTGNVEPQPIAAEQIDQIRDQADIDGYFYDYEKKGYKLELLPDEELEGTKTYVIKITKPNNDVITNYLDAEKCTILKTKTKMKIQGVDAEMESYFSDYKPVEELIYPFSVENKMNGQTMMHLVMDSVEFNKEIPDSLFSIPEKK